MAREIRRFQNQIAAQMEIVDKRLSVSETVSGVNEISMIHHR